MMLSTQPTLAFPAIVPNTANSTEKDPHTAHRQAVAADEYLARATNPSDARSIVGLG